MAITDTTETGPKGVARARHVIDFDLIDPDRGQRLVGTGMAIAISLFAGWAVWEVLS